MNVRFPVYYILNQYDGLGLLDKFADCIYNMYNYGE